MVDQGRGGWCGVDVATGAVDPNNNAALATATALPAAAATPSRRAATAAAPTSQADFEEGKGLLFEGFCDVSLFRGSDGGEAGAALCEAREDGG